MIRYLNTKQYGNVETIDQLDRDDFISYKAFRDELKRLKSEYSMAGIHCYTSQRSTNKWKEY